MCVLLWLASFTYVFKAHQMAYVSVLPPFYFWTFIVWIHHIFFIHSPVNAHLHCLYFWLLLIMLLWTFVYKFLYRSKFSVQTMFSHLEKWDCWFLLNLFKDLSDCFPNEMSHFAFPHHCERLLLSAFDYNHPMSVKWYGTSLWFWCMFPWQLMTSSILSCT